MKPKNLASQLKAMALKSEKSLLTIANESGVPQSTLYRFCNEYDKNDLSLPNVQKLLDYFGFTLAVTSKTK